MALQSINLKDKYLILLIPILFLAAFLRFYNLPATLDFNGDLGRDALSAKRIIVDHKLALIGPRASGGVFFLGPLYYYLIIPALLIFNFSPLGPVYLTALFGLLTVVAIYWAGLRLFDKGTALLSALLYSVSPLVIRYSRVSGNYTLLPFFSLLAILFFWHWLKTKEGYNLFMFAFISGLALQLHYSTVVLLFFALPCLLLFRVNPFHYKRQFLSAGLILIFLNSPLILFDLRHNWANLSGLIDYLFLGSGDEARRIVGAESWSFLNSFEFLAQTTLGIISPFLVIYWDKKAAIIWLIVVFLLIYSVRKKTFSSSFFFLFSLVLFALVFSSFYKGYLADYYLAFIFPIPILLFANLLRILTRKVKFLHGTMAILILGLSVFNLKNLPFRTSARSINQQREVASIITNDVSSTEKFNLFLKRETPFWSTASEYRYLVEVMGKRALEPTNYKNSEVVYFIAEIPVSEPLKVGDWEIKEFGPKKIEKTWELPKEVFIYKMRR